MPRATIVLSRTFRKDEETRPNDDLVDGIMHHVTDLPHVGSVRILPNGLSIVDHADEIDIGDGVTFQMIDTVTAEQDGETVVKAYSVRISSETLDVPSIMKILREHEARYALHRQNKFGTHAFYFGNANTNLQKRLVMSRTGHPIGAAINYDSAPKNTPFSMTRFRTTRSLTNIYGDTIRKLRKHVEFFMNNRAWYESRGIPYTLGILLYGPPGTGKTSVIKALAHDFGRHIVDVKLSDHITNTQLSNMFLSDEIHVMKNDGSGNTERVRVPMEDRIMVLEDIDCVSATFARKADGVGMSSAMPEVDEPHPEKPTLATFLNLLDGILETPGRILIMTTNHPEVLDDALVRPGRVDIVCNLDRCSGSEVAEILTGITGEDVPSDAFEDGKWTPAEVCQAALKNVGDLGSLVRELAR